MHSKNKLIIILSSHYKGGAQRRYLSLFNYLQKTNREDYFLLLNNVLYTECLHDNILTNTKNIIRVQINYIQKSKSDRKQKYLIKKINKQRNLNQISNLYSFLGTLSSFVKQFKGWLGYSINLIKIIKHHKIAVIYGVFTGGIWSWQVAKLLKVKFIYSYNDSSLSTIENNLLKLFKSEYYPLKMAYRVDFLSEGIKNKLLENGITITKERTLISPSSFILYDNYYPEYPKKNRIVFSARMEEIKNPFLLLDAVLILKQSGITNFEVIYLGNGNLLEKLVIKKNQLNLDNVYIEGGVSDTAEYLRPSKIFISIQQDNNYPSQSLLEAMACENAIIASDVGETRKLVTINEGILVPLSANNLAISIQHLLSSPYKCEQLGKNARKKVLKEHTVEKFAEYFYKITNI